LLTLELVSADSFIAQHAICIGVARGIDSQWFGLFLQAIALCLLIPSVMWLAKRLWNVDPATWSWRGDVEKAAAKAATSSDDLEKMSKGNVQMISDMDKNDAMAPIPPYVTNFVPANGVPPGVEQVTTSVAGLNGVPVTVQQSGKEMVMTPTLPPLSAVSPLTVPSPH